MGNRFENKEGAIVMLCMECGARAEKGFTTDVTDLGNCLVIVRNVPCYKCTECNEVIYTADVVKHLETIVEQAKKMMQEISIIDYSKVA
jgi:YgiT-type zinc finger domain-containing protein